MTARERACCGIHDLLPGGCRVGPPSFDPVIRAWAVTAHSPRHAGHHAPPPATISGSGEDELAALTDLALPLPSRRRWRKTADLTDAAFG